MGFGEPCLVSAKSAIPAVAAFTVVGSEEELLAALLSPVADSCAFRATTSLIVLLATWVEAGKAYPLAYAELFRHGPSLRYEVFV
jgi:hypothetical protein